MTSLVILGAVIAGLGLAVLLYWMWQVFAVRNSAQNENQIRAILQKAVMWNLIAMGISGIGLMVIIVGLVLS